MTKAKVGNNLYDYIPEFCDINIPIKYICFAYIKPVRHNLPLIAYKLEVASAYKAASNLGFTKQVFASHIKQFITKQALNVTKLAFKRKSKRILKGVQVLASFPSVVRILIISILIYYQFIMHEMS